MVNAQRIRKPDGIGSEPSQIRARLSLGLAFSSVLLVAAASPFLGPLGENFHSVIPGCVYRSGQLSSESLEDRATRDGIRSVINLRGANLGDEWYEMECAVARRQHLKLYDLPVDSQCPTAPELRELLGVLEACPKPVLIHCKSGIDRSGIVAAICVLLLDESGSIEQAQTHLGWRYGHMPWCDNLSVQERLLQDYQSWLAARALSHDRARFRTWLRLVSGQGVPANQQPTASR
jgi:protein tyrosine/serine phosphatase